MNKDTYTKLFEIFNSLVDEAEELDLFLDDIEFTEIMMGLEDWFFENKKRVTPLCNLLN